MILRGLFLMDGPSDAPIADHLVSLCGDAGRTVRITAPDLRRLPSPPGRLDGAGANASRLGPGR